MNSVPRHRRLAGGALGLALLLTSVGGVVAQDATPGATPNVAADATPIGTPAASPVALALGSMTATRPFLIADDPGKYAITPVLTRGDMVGDYQFAGTPDGMGFYKDGGDVVGFVIHEFTPKEAGSDEGNLSGGRVSRLVMDAKTGAVTSGSYALKGGENYWDLCSASLADAANGYSTPTFLSGEETTSSPMGGVVFAVDGATSAVTPMPWMGHFHHENEVPVPGFGDKKVVFLTDDNSKASEVYIYVANNQADLISGVGQLYVFKADAAAGTADVQKGKDVAGQFVAIGQKDNADADSLQKAVDAAGAFKFVRAEDSDYNHATPNVIYFADTGDIAAPNLAADGTPLTKNGRIYRMTLDPADPTKVTAFTVMLDGDKGDDIRNPDNVASSIDGKTVMLQEDLNGYNRKLDGLPGRVLAFDIAGSTLSVVATLDQSDGPGMTDPDVKAGEWESSGIIDVSDIYGPGMWITGVQAHTRATPQFGGVDEGGQLLLIQQK